MENLKIEGFIWLETSDGLKIGRGRALLLEEIERTGSIAAAARNTNIPYRKAWGMIKELNNSNTQPLVLKSVGGREGGGAVLTHEGKKILSEFKRINKQFFLFKNNTL